jgi:hypothetical protein
MRRRVETKREVFANPPVDEIFGGFPKKVWQVIAQDFGSYRIGLYSPEASSFEEITELEKHDCKEFFILLKGRVVLVLGDDEGGIREVELEPLKPIVVERWHCGYCPDGPFTGLCLVVERDEFVTDYRPTEEWKKRQEGN